MSSASPLQVPNWTNRPLVLFHGTTLPAANSVVESGVDVTRSVRPDLDFGTGFYCTTVEWQAEKRARDKSRALGHRPAIVQLTVPRKDIAALSVLSFVRGERDAYDFWSLVEFFRNGGAAKEGGALHWVFPYDIVFGPVALWRNRQPMPGSDPISFHTDAAQQLLNEKSTRSIITI